MLDLQTPLGHCHTHRLQSMTKRADRAFSWRCWAHGFTHLNFAVVVLILPLQEIHPLQQLLLVVLELPHGGWLLSKPAAPPLTAQRRDPRLMLLPLPGAESAELLDLEVLVPVARP